jgi:hypothetical protein
VLEVIKKTYALLYGAVAVLFAVLGAVIVVLAVLEVADALLTDEPLGKRFRGVLEGVGMLTIAVAAFELSQTVVEEEILRESKLAAPTRVRRFMSRFLVVVIVASSIEMLIAIFNALHEDSARLVHAAAVGIGTAALLAAWGYFVGRNRLAEKLEPEALEDAKREDDDV